MQINVKALIEHLQYQKTALVFYLNAGLITQAEHDKAFKGLMLMEKLHDLALENKSKFKDVEITERYTF